MKSIKESVLENCLRRLVRSIARMAENIARHSISDVLNSYFKWILLASKRELRLECMANSFIPSIL